MSLNRLIAGVAIAGLAVLTATPTVPSFAVERGSSQTQTQQFAQHDQDNWNRDWNDRWRDRNPRRYCYYERRGRRIFYCCRDRVWNGRYYQVRVFCQPERR